MTIKDIDTSAFDLHSIRLSAWEKISTHNHEIELQSLNDILNTLLSIEYFWAYPGKEVMYQLQKYMFENNEAAFNLLSRNVYNSLRHKLYSAQEYTPFYTNLTNLDKPQSDLLASEHIALEKRKYLKPYFEVLIIHPSAADFELLYRNSLANYKIGNDDFLYDIIFVDNYHDAIIATLSNSDIQTCIYLDIYNVKKSEFTPDALAIESAFEYFVKGVPDESVDKTIALKKHIHHLRPEIDHFYISEGIASAEHQMEFDRIAYAQSESFFADIHNLIISGMEQRYSTPFFDALRSYAKRPKGSFHALPISQGRSIQSSHWIKDVADFYGDGIFSAETSSTLGGMDSIMDPKGSISQAQNKASKLFKSKRTFFVTNGTTTANKIVMQANLHPDDIVLVSSDCHKSIPYSVLLLGATPVFLETYPLNEYDLYGCVTLKRIKQVLLDLKSQNKLHKVKQITLTNSTFDGVIYDVKRYMMDILAIKPDIIFHWDEAWFSFGYFNPLYQGKTAMSAANALTLMKADKGYRELYESWSDRHELDDDFLLNNDLYPDPDAIKIRVYSTQSIHKTLTAFRQASMLHEHDVDYAEDVFYEAYRTHTSTSPNYQIIASLDFARRQMSLEGYSIVKESIHLAWELRNKISSTPGLSRYFKVLDDRHLVPEEYRQSNKTNDKYSMYYANVYSTYRERLFVVDPTRVTVDISATGIEGPNFRQMLMTQYDIQVNKTSHNTILFIINIGVDKNNIQYLLESLQHIANKLDNSPSINKNDEYKVNLPLTRNYHEKFVTYQSNKSNNFQAVDMRRAYYAGFNEGNVEYETLSNELMKRVMNDYKPVSAGFITPYPPGFPIIVPGQLITYDLLLYLQNIQIKEIHGYDSDKGLKIFTSEYLLRESE